MEKKIIYNGESVNIGPLPLALIACGYKDRSEVTIDARRFCVSPGTMSIDNAVQYLKEHYPQPTK